MYYTNIVGLKFNRINFFEFLSDKYKERWVSSEHSGKEWGDFVLTHGKFYGDAEANKGKPKEEQMSYGSANGAI